jgi:hypothetical protein
MKKIIFRALLAGLAGFAPIVVIFVAMSDSVLWHKREAVIRDIEQDYRDMKAEFRTSHPWSHRNG